MKTVLIAEDEKFIRLGLKTMVQRSCVPVEEILEARDGVEALALLKEHPVDLLMTDIRMPHMDGIELVEQAAKLPEPPMVLVVSGYEDFNYALAMLRNGVSDYLLKPVEREKLCEVLQKLEVKYQEKMQQESQGQKQYHHAVKFLMLEREENSKEAEELISRYREEFFEEGYYVIYCSEAPDICTAETLVVHVENQGVVLIVPEEEYGAEKSALAVEIAGVSNRTVGLDNLKTAYLEAFAWWKQSYFTGKGCMELWKTKEKVSTVTAEQLLSMVSFSKDKEIMNQLKALADKVMAGELPPDQFAWLCRDFIQGLCDTYKTMFETAENPVRFAKIWEFSSARQYLSELEQWLLTFCERVAQEYTDFEKKQKIEQAIRYIHENYCSSLNMAVVSNEVSMNYSLFSILFKQYTGTNFINYLQNLRLEEAKRLLVSTDLRVAEICKKVGFGDEKHFLKQFKLLTGLSPTEYRKSQFRQEKLGE